MNSTERSATGRDPSLALDWTGRPVECAGCAHRDLLHQNTCGPLWSCVHDRYAPRIDRFFATHSELANTYLAHPYFEVRAVAAKHADLFRLPALLDDPDETVRWSAVARLPARMVARLMRDPDREVRIRVAARIDPGQLTRMIEDPDYYVRQVVARRLPADLLPRLAADPDTEVRKVVAARAEGSLLPRLARDPEPEVRLIAVERMAPWQLIPLTGDTDWRVRHVLARRMPPQYLGALWTDPDDEVRRTARERTLIGVPEGSSLQSSLHSSSSAGQE